MRCSFSGCCFKEMFLTFVFDPWCLLGKRVSRVVDRDRVRYFCPSQEDFQSDRKREGTNGFPKVRESMDENISGLHSKEKLRNYRIRKTNQAVEF